MKTTAGTNKQLHALTIDVEDRWNLISRQWLHRDIEPTESVVNNTEWLLDTLEKDNVKATFFILGDVAAKFPSLIKQISNKGHEIGLHGLSHKQIFNLTADEFRREMRDGKKMLEDITSLSVRGYRAPAFSVMPETKWALEVLAEEGFAYDSSIVPCQNKRYGWKGFGKDICNIALPCGLKIIEVPLSTIQIPVIGKGFVVGGGYLRHFPYAVSKLAIKTIEKQRPVVAYIHPYEFANEPFELSVDHLPQQERSKVLRHVKLLMRNESTMPDKLLKLLSDFNFTTLWDIIQTKMGDPPERNSSELKNI